MLSSPLCPRAKWEVTFFFLRLFLRGGKSSRQSVPLEDRISYSVTPSGWSSCVIHHYRTLDKSACANLSFLAGPVSPCKDIWPLRQIGFYRHHELTDVQNRILYRAPCCSGGEGYWEAAESKWMSHHSPSAITSTWVVLIKYACPQRVSGEGDKINLFINHMFFFSALFCFKLGRFLRV